MANEITLSISLQVAKGGASVGGSLSAAFDLTGNEMVSAVVRFPDGAAYPIFLGGIDQERFIMIRNLSTTDSLTVWSDSGVNTEISIIPPNGAILLAGLPTRPYGQFQGAISPNDILVVAVEN